MLENGLPIALAKQGCNISLEPGGQFELSGAPLETLHQTCCEVHTHLDEVKKIAEPLGIGMLGMGFQPKWRREDIPWMPKGRYAIMGAYMPKVGKLGLDMMLRTCTVQVNLDFASEADMVRKFQVSLALQPIATALFANSPFVEGRPVGLSQLAQPHLDRHRPRPLGHACRSCSSPAWASSAMSTRCSTCRCTSSTATAATSTPAASRSATSWPAGCRRCRASGRRINDWGDHLTTAFPEVRLKRFLEMRGADAGSWRSLCGLPALWTGLLYDDAALDAAAELVRDWTPEDHAWLRAEVPKTALAHAVPQRHGGDVAREVVAIAKAGLAARARIDWDGQDETALPQSPGADRRRRPHPGRGEARALPRGLGRQGRPGVRGVCVLAAPASAR